MKTVNLLPDWYTLQQRQMANLRVHMFVMMMLGAGMVLCMGLAKTRLSAVERRYADLAKQSKDVGNPQEQLQKQQSELQRLKNLQLAYRELGNTVPMSAVIQQVQNDMTEGMALSRVSIDVHPEPVKGSSFVGAKTAPKLHDVAHLQVVGIAPNDTQIAQLIGKLSTNQLFSDVSLNYTRTEILRDYSVRRFEIQMQMDLEPLAAEDPDSPAEASKSLAEGATGHAG